MVRERIWNQIGEIVEVSRRMIGLFLKIGKRGCWLLQVYGPMNDATKEVREKFWAELREEVERRRRTAAVVIMGDINGRVGNRQEDWEVVGWYVQRASMKMEHVA